MSAPASGRAAILMVTGAYFPELSGGGLQSRTMIQALEKWFAFSVFTTCTDPALPTEDLVEGIPVTRVYVDIARPSTKIAASLRTVSFFLSRRRSFDIVHLHGFSQKSILIVLLSRLLGKRVMITIHTAVHDEPEGVRRLGRLAYWCYSHADRFLAISEAMARNYRAAGLPESRLRIVPNGVDLDRFRPAQPGERDQCCRDLGLDPATRWIAFVGFFSREKNPDLLLAAWLSLPAAVRDGTGLVFVGATDSKYHEVDRTVAEQMREDAARAGLSDRVRFLGELPGVERVYRAADLLAMPSTREAFGMVLVEAMASGLPTVATRLEGVTTEIVEGGTTGLLVPSRDRTALSAAIQSLMSDRAAASAMGMRARLAVGQRYGINVINIQWREIYGELLIDELPYTFKGGRMGG